MPLLRNFARILPLVVALCVLFALHPNVNAAPTCATTRVTDVTSLDEAIQGYNLCGNGENITITVGGFIQLDQILTDIDNTSTAVLTITGGTLDGAETYRILNIENGNVILSSITLQNGRRAIDNADILTLINAALLNNQSTQGGAIFSNNLGTVTIIDSTFSDNQATGNGGAVNAGGDLTIRNSTFSGNTANGLGGAVLASYTLEVETSTFYNNTAQDGGAIFIASGSPITAYIINSTFTLNSATQTGGAIHNKEQTLITNSTFNANKADERGGALYNNTGVFGLRNTILANSTTSADAPMNDCYDASGTVTFNSSGAASNIITLDATGGNACGVLDTDYVNADPLLGSLANNGGSVFTLLPSASSPAIDNGDNAAAIDENSSPLTTDARSAPRIIGTQVDLGAVEFIPAVTEDVNGDGYITPVDAVYVANRQDTGDLSADVNGDGFIDTTDFNLVISALGQTFP